jgi:hypothetical protein
LGKPVIPPRPGLKNATITSDYIYQCSQPQQNTAVTRVIGSNNTSILAKKSRHNDQFIKEMIRIELHHYNINRENGFSLSKVWNLKERKNVLSKARLPLELVLPFT